MNGEKLKNRKLNKGKLLTFGFKKTDNGYIYHTNLAEGQITFTQYLSHKGSKRATIENVRVAKDRRNLGIGTLLMKYAINLAKENSCTIVQLTSNKTRTDAHRFYKRLGFQDTHEGLKLNIL